MEYDSTGVVRYDSHKVSMKKQHELADIWYFVIHSIWSKMFINLTRPSIYWQFIYMYAFDWYSNIYDNITPVYLTYESVHQWDWPTETYHFMHAHCEMYILCKIYKNMEIN